VKLLLSDKRVDPSADDNYTIRYASEKGYYKIVELLLSDERVDPSAEYNYAVKWASRIGNFDIVKLLLSDKRLILLLRIIMLLDTLLKMDIIKL
jgi:hypothetical protein